MTGQTNDHRGDPASPERRRFLERLSIALGAAAAAVVAIPSGLFLLLPVKTAPQQWRSVGAEGEFQPASTISVSFDDPAPLPWSFVTANGRPAAPRCRRPVHGLRHQLHPSRLSRQLGSGRRTVHVPLPRRRL